MSTTTPTELRLQQIVARQLKVDPSRVDLDRALLEDLGLDSLDVMNVIFEIEDAFSPVTISDEVARDLHTLRELAAFIDRQRAGEARS